MLVVLGGKLGDTNMPESMPLAETFVIFRFLSSRRV
jgi:hypothetical protein